MKTIKLILAVALLQTSVCAKLLAQQNQRIEQARELTKELKEKLNLSDEQNIKIQDIFKAHRKNIKENIMNKSGMSKEEKLKMMKAERAKTDEQIMAVLDDNQKKIYQQEKEVIKDKMRENVKQNRRTMR